MAILLALYRTPKDKAAFDRYYRETHVPLAKKIPGLRRYEISDGTVAGPEGPSNIHLVALLHFDSVDAIKAAIGTPDGQAAAGDLSNFADGGVDLMFIDTKPA
ncbi:MAG: EthD family reductase [Mesorhizobium sp.]|jgi:uncharacterized protein (TIGR02118 family)